MILLKSISFGPRIMSIFARTKARLVRSYNPHALYIDRLISIEGEVDSEYSLFEKLDDRYYILLYTKSSNPQIKRMMGKAIPTSDMIQNRTNCRFYINNPELMISYIGRNNVSERMTPKVIKKQFGEVTGFKNRGNYFD